MVFGAIARVTDLCDALAKPPDVIRCTMVLALDTDSLPMTSASMAVRTKLIRQKLPMTLGSSIVDLI